MMAELEIQVDRIVGPTHHFGGLGLGNLASIEHAGRVSHPAAAACEGLDKMRAVASRGVPQLILAPQRRPSIAFLRSLGFRGKPHQVLQQALEQAPQLLSAACSSSAMWTANAATVTPASDTSDGRLKLSIANLSSSMHRSLEPSESFTQLQETLQAALGETAFDLFPELEGGFAFRDEGAANHMRLSSPATPNDTNATAPAIHLFVYGDGLAQPTRYLARQSRAACEAIARRHLIPSRQAFFLQQNPEAIDAGAFHNDVVATSHHDLLLYHEKAFLDTENTLDQITAQFADQMRIPLKRYQVQETELSLEDAVATYLFNSQIITATRAMNGGNSHASESVHTVILCPTQVREHAEARTLVEHWCHDLGWFDEIVYVSVTESMSGGGGPACLRLRIPIDADDLGPLDAACWWSEETDARLRQVIESHYPKSLSLSDLAHPKIIEQARVATQNIERVLRGEAAELHG